MANYSKLFGTMDQGLKMREYPCFFTANSLSNYKMQQESFYGVPPDVGLQKEPCFRKLILGQAGEQTQATCLARSGAIHYVLRTFISFLHQRIFNIEDLFCHL
jgi:hypothetical protein